MSRLAIRLIIPNNLGCSHTHSSNIFTFLSSNFANGNGIRMDGSSNNRIENSTFSNNDDWGIRLLTGCDLNIFYNNIISENGGNILNLSDNNIFINKTTFWIVGINIYIAPSPMAHTRGQ